MNSDGIDCTECGHAIVNDSTCRCPGSCATCPGVDCCCESWAQFERMKDHAKGLHGRVSGGTS